MSDLLQEALRGDGFTLSYQALAPLRQRAGERYEAQLRLRTTDGELIPSFDFLPVAREVGLMSQIDRWVVQRALDESQIRRETHPGLQILIHQALDSASSPHWVIWLRDEIARRDLIHQRPALIFDLDDVTTRMDQALARFGELRRLGIDLCINHMDDSPGAVQVFAQLPVSMVRLRQGALGEMTNARLMELVRIVHQRGVALIAAGIEDPQTIARTWGCGADFIQGNFVQPAGDGFDFDFEGSELG